MFWGGVTDEAEREEGTRGLGSQTPPKAVNNGLVPRKLLASMGGNCVM